MRGCADEDGVGDAAPATKPLSSRFIGSVYLSNSTSGGRSPALFHRQRLEVRDERAGRRQVGLGLRVEAAMDRLIRDAGTAAPRSWSPFDAGIRVARIEVVQLSRGTTT